MSRLTAATILVVVTFVIAAFSSAQEWADDWGDTGSVVFLVWVCVLVFGEKR